MKNFKISLLLVALSFLLLPSCKSTSKAIKAITESKKIDVQKALETGAFKVIRAASAIKVRTIKNGNIPVLGSLNIKTGRLNINPGAKSLLELVIDMTSWDSGLTVRDDRITQIFFESIVDRNRVALFQVNSIPAESIEKLKKDKKLDGLAVQGTLNFHGVTIPVDAILNVSFSQIGRLVVTSAKPIAIKISDLKMNELLKRLIIICNHQSVEDVITLNVHLEFEPIVKQVPQKSS